MIYDNTQISISSDGSTVAIFMVQDPPWTLHAGQLHDEILSMIAELKNEKSLIPEDKGNPRRKGKRYSHCVVILKWHYNRYDNR